MEPAEKISEEWSSLSGVYTVEETDLMNQLLGNCSVPEQFYESTENINTFYFPAQVPSTNSMCFFQGSSSTADSGKYVFPTKNGGNYSNNSVTNSGHVSIGFSLHGNDGKLMNENTDEELGFDTGREVLADMNLQAHKEREILVSEPEKDKTRSLGKSEKRSRSSFEVPKNKRNVKFKNNPKPASISNNTEEDTLNNICCSDSNASQELHGGASSSLSLKDSTALKLTAKSRSSRDPATDPQSAYARRRRERINERLRILQNLVPNGTKVDISTMLEEAVQYVKFLQLQIKVLSSDDMWMYAPITYNGMNIGQQLNINATKQPNNA